MSLNEAIKVCYEFGKRIEEEQELSPGRGKRTPKLSGKRDNEWAKRHEKEKIMRMCEK